MLRTQPVTTEGKARSPWLITRWMGLAGESVGRTVGRFLGSSVRDRSRSVDSGAGPEHHDEHGNVVEPGRHDVARLVAGGVTLSAFAVRGLFFSSLAFPAALELGLTLAATLATGYPFFRSGL